MEENIEKKRGGTYVEGEGMCPIEISILFFLFNICPNLEDFNIFFFQ